MEDLTKIDPNFNAPSTAGKNMNVLDIEEAPFKIYGVYKEGGHFVRMPGEVALTVSQGVSGLYGRTSGGRVKFKTNSKFVALKAVFPNLEVMPLMPFSGSSAFDLYADGKFVNTFMPSWGELRELYKTPFERSEYEGIIEFPDRRERDITINFPLYNNVNKVFLGFEEDASVSEGDGYRDGAPVVFYGSSITQGGCVTHPGNLYANILSRKLNFNFINLGFAGAAKAEDAIADYIASLDMSLFVYDYDHNAPNEDHLRATHYKMYKKVRDAHPNIPIVMASRPAHGIPSRIKIITDTYDRAKAEGDNNIYFINGMEEIEKLIDPDMMTMDGCHPNDFGAYCMATAFEKVLKNLI